MTNQGIGKTEYDYLLKSSEIANLPTEKVPDGSTAYVVDTQVLKIFYDGQWWDM